MTDEEKEKSEKKDKKVKDKPRKSEDDSYLISYTKHLERKVRALTAEKQLIESEKIRLDREVRSIKTELDRMRQPPLVTARVEKVLEDGRIIVKSTTGPRFIVKYSKQIEDEEFSPGTYVALNQRTFSIVEIIPESEETQYTADRAWSGLPYEIKIIEVRDWKEISNNLQDKFFIQFKNLEDLKLVAKSYRLPVLFKKSDEYIALYCDNHIFWYKP